jgi:hypothetical protein
MRKALLQVFAFAGVFATTLSPTFAQCTVARDCGGGTSVQCSGTTSCQALSSGVECDGTPITTCSPPQGACYLELYCSNGFIFFCSGANTCSTDISNQTITCDETIPSGYPGGVKVGNLTTYSCSYCDSHPNECDAAGR